MKLSRRSFVAALCAAALLFVFHWAWAQGKSNVPAAAQSVDLLLTGGEVHDGTGAKARKADVGIKGDRIAFIGDAKKSKVTAARTIDVKGLIVTPGFIDTHTHAGDDLANESRKGNVNYLTQGVTTVSVGNDGHGSSHILPILQKWETQGIGTNAFLLAGHGAIRREVLGPGDVQPTPEQLEKMKALVREAMQSGAFGLSSGLFYTPGTYSKTEEVIELARVAGEMGGIYDTHMRDESSYSIGFLGSIRESIRIAREGKVHLNIAHIKCLGPDVWGQSAEAIALVRAAQREGVSITADQYPYTASGTGLNAALLPPWAQAGRREEVLAKLKDPAQREKLLKDMTDNLKRRGGADSLLFRSKQDPELLGKTLEQVAKARGTPPVETALNLIIATMEGNRTGSLSVASFNMNEKDIEAFMREPWVNTGSDGSAGHPRMYGTYPRKLREYVFKRKVITLPFFVRASTSGPAKAFRIAERGELREGWFADIAVFDAKTITDKATYVEPEILSEGMKFVIVNGKLAVEDGKYTGALAGRALRKTP